MSDDLIKFGNNVEVSEVSNQIIDNIIDGNLDPLHVAISFKRIQKVIDSVKNNTEIKEAINRETLKYTTGNEKRPAFGAMVEYAPTYTKYDYKACNHPELEEYNKILIICKARIKELEKELQSAPSGGVDIIVETEPKLDIVSSGEVVKVYPPTKKQTFGTKIFV
tara:strand:+ start:17488 stop:17982 length:495 start_codon:yes stop_codon:yes gene_type:complete